MFKIHAKMHVSSDNRFEDTKSFVLSYTDWFTTLRALPETNQHKFWFHWLCWVLGCVGLNWFELGWVDCVGKVCEGVWGWVCVGRGGGYHRKPKQRGLYQDYGGKIGKMADFGEFHPGTKPLPYSLRRIRTKPRYRRTIPGFSSDAAQATSIILYNPCMTPRCMPRCLGFLWRHHSKHVRETTLL